MAEQVAKEPLSRELAVRNPPSRDPPSRELCAASIRSLAGQTSAFFRASQLIAGSSTVNTPALHRSLELQIGDQRALADAFSLRLLHHDKELHFRLRPDDGVQLLVFEILEQLRIESLTTEPGLSSLPGMRRNLQRRFIDWIAEVQATNLVENHAGILIFTLAVACWARLNSEEIPSEVDGLIEATRAGLGAEVGPVLQQLYKQKTQQQEYAQSSLLIATVIETMLLREAQGGDSSAQGVELEENVETVLRDLRESGMALLNVDDAGLAVLPFASLAEDGRLVGEAGLTYRVFTTEYDQEGPAIDLVRPEKLRKLRTELDDHVRNAGINVARYANELRTQLARPSLGGWSSGEEIGYLDSARLCALVSNPMDHQIFRRERWRLQSDCHVTVLLDCSGSMKQHSVRVAVLCDLLNRAFGQAGLSSEVLGFTTGSWNGGRVYKRWLALGRPKNPGRLNEQKLTVFKSAEQSWRRAKPGIAALLRTDLYREGVDGEALLWAHKRAVALPQTRKVIMVVSDGSPMDTSTALTNGEFYLDQHLQYVAQKIEASAETALCALGVGLDLSPYYRDSLAFDTACELSLSHLQDIAKLLHRALLRK